MIKKEFEFVVSTDFQESDWEPLFNTMYQAFEDVLEITVMYPHGLDPAYSAEYAARFKAGSIGNGKTERAVAKLTEKHSGEIVSYIAGSVYRGSHGMADDAKPPPSQLPMIEDPETRAFYEWYWTTLSLELRTKVKETQVPNVYIQSIFTHPKWQRHGGASILMEWMVGIAIHEKDIGSCSLLASPVALEARFYEKFGFRIVYEKNMVDEKRFPGREGQFMTVMIRGV